MSIATNEEQQAAQASVQAWARATAPIQNLRERPATMWRPGWESLADLGIFAVAVPEAAGGAGAGVVDLATMLEQAAHHLATGPVLPTALAALVFGRAAGTDGAKWTELLAEGTLPTAVALDGALTATTREGGYDLDGDAGPALGGEPGVAVLVRIGTDGGTERWALLDADTPGLNLEPLDTLDKSRALARVRLAGVAVTTDRVVCVPAGLVRDLAATLAAAELAGVAGWALATAVEYAKIREQFGKPIGSFQAIKHLCAEMLCRTEKIRAAAWDAAVAADAAPHELPLAAAVATAVALDAAVQNAKDAIQVLGGIGFTWEHDAHLYLRRAVVTRQLLGGSAAWRARVAGLARSGARRHLTVDLSAFDDERVRIRAEIAQLLDRPGPQRRAALAEAGFLAPHWPPPYGRGAHAAQQILIEEELAAAGVDRPDLVIGWWAVPTILEHGTAEQIDRFALPTLRGEIVWCQLFSEPGAGSDLASLRTAAEKVDGGWRLQGQKVWTSLAQEADWAICLARTDRDAPKHKGITYFLVDMKSAGITVSPLREITGDALFNEVFLDGVFVPDECVVGPLGGGWKLARTTLANERVAMSGGSSLGKAVEQLLDLVAPGDPVAEDRIGGLVAEATAGSLLELRTTLAQLDGQDPGPASSVRKLIGVRQRQDTAELAMDLAGAAGWVEGPLAREFLNTRCLTIAGGTEQILLTLAAERLLGLPRG
ncbi:acyl-CoA dehydrogenase family protein [Rhodococcus aetherivorans]|uniref:acyl-CoA dehydrogenase family protein n=1 Tax=Rhodococcus aetherivorans TaxID=191292 RepID=UPI0002D231C8|nr:acyl-CoA dehydrogenase family protein [Rhodococcus aetherivorans]KDE14583.1 acyl-CoA dehydrogenase [Rhodococcus aetherivorans]WKW99421.1 acyl-CoA dehydrogenase family protein [Rhodococcus aetherivorans]CCW14039.1 Butyryl-CoA dehydrogenase [Rhodococcus aetherivorans]